MSVYAVRESGESLRFLRSDIAVVVAVVGSEERGREGESWRRGRRVTRRVTGRVPESRGRPQAAWSSLRRLRLPANSQHVRARTDCETAARASDRCRCAGHTRTLTSVCPSALLSHQTAQTASTARRRLRWSVLGSSKWYVCAFPASAPSSLLDVHRAAQSAEPPSSSSSHPRIEVLPPQQKCHNPMRRW